MLPDSLRDSLRGLWPHDSRLCVTAIVPGAEVSVVGAEAFMHQAAIHHATAFVERIVDMNTALSVDPDTGIDMVVVDAYVLSGSELMALICSAYDAGIRDGHSGEAPIGA